MAIDQRIQTLEDEHKVLKGELKQTLENIRDFLLDLNLPALQDDGPSEIHEHNEQHGSGGGGGGGGGEGNNPPEQSEPNNGLFPPLPSQSGTQGPGSFGEHGGGGGIPPISMITTVGPMPQQNASPPVPQEVQTPQIIEQDDEPSITTDTFDDQEELMEIPEFHEEPSTGQKSSLQQDEPILGQELPVQNLPLIPEEADELPSGHEEDDEILPDQIEDDSSGPGLLSEDSPENEVEDAGISPYEIQEKEPDGDMLPGEVSVDEPENDTPQPEVAVPSGQPKNQGSRDEMQNHTSHVNLLTSLIQWVASARKEIGNEQLPAFLNVYGISGHLTSELREVILYLAETIAPKEARAGDTVRQVTDNKTDPEAVPNEETNNVTEIESEKDAVTPPYIGGDADTWNRMILELHGILSQGDVLLHTQQLLLGKSEEIQPLQVENMEQVRKFVENTVENMEGPTGGELSPEDIPQLDNDSTADAVKDEKEDEEIKVVKKPRSKNKKRKSKSKSSATPGKKEAILKLVLPIDDDSEEEFSIGGFSLNLLPEVIKQAKGK